MIQDSEQITVDLVGEKTGERYEGVFKFKTKITRADAFVADRMRRDIIGPNWADAIDSLIWEAHYVSQLRMRILDAPAWWLDTNYTMGLEDDNLSKSLYDLAMGAEKKRTDSIKEKAAGAAKEMKKKKEL